MYLGKTLFAQVMDFLPWKTFHRIVDRYGGDYRTRSLRCAEQFRVMAFAQLSLHAISNDAAQVLTFHTKAWSRLLVVSAICSLAHSGKHLTCRKRSALPTFGN